MIWTPLFLRKLAPGRGLAPRFCGSKPRVLLIDDPGMKVVGTTGIAPATSPSRTAYSAAELCPERKWLWWKVTLLHESS